MNMSLRVSTSQLGTHPVKGTLIRIQSETLKLEGKAEHGNLWVVEFSLSTREVCASALATGYRWVWPDHDYEVADHVAA
jgi:hypothetical protein